MDLFYFVFRFDTRTCNRSIDDYLCRPYNLSKAHHQFIKVFQGREEAIVKYLETPVMLDTSEREGPWYVMMKKKTHQTTRTSLLVGITSRQYIMYVEREKWSASRKLDEREQFQQPVRSSFHINTEMGFFFYWPDVDNLLIQSVRELGDCCLTITGHHSTKCFRYPPSEV